jgi:hypothetical protein
VASQEHKLSDRTGGTGRARAGGAAPYSLLSNCDVQTHARTILRVTQRRFMPPWQPEPGHGQFRDDRRLSNQQIALFRRWVETEMAEGDTAGVGDPGRTRRPCGAGQAVLGDVSSNECGISMKKKAMHLFFVTSGRKRRVVPRPRKLFFCATSLAASVEVSAQHFECKGRMHRG